jgi:hypothetical protein
MHLTDYFNQSIATAREDAETQRKEVAAHRQRKKVKTDGKKKAPSKASHQPPAENVRGLARYLDGAELRDKDLSDWDYGHSFAWGSARITPSQGRR